MTHLSKLAFRRKTKKGGFLPDASWSHEIHSRFQATVIEKNSFASFKYIVAPVLILLYITGCIFQKLLHSICWHVYSFLLLSSVPSRDSGGAFFTRSLIAFDNLTCNFACLPSVSVKLNKQFLFDLFPRLQCQVEQVREKQRNREKLHCFYISLSVPAGGDLTSCQKLVRPVFFLYNCSQISSWGTRSSTGEKKKKQLLPGHLQFCFRAWPENMTVTVYDAQFKGR